MQVNFESRQLVTNLDTTERKKAAHNTGFASGGVISNSSIKYLLLRPNAKPETICNNFAELTKNNKP